MTTFNITLVDTGGSYSQLGEANVQVGTTVTVNVASSSNYSIVSETGGAPALGNNKATPAQFVYGVAGSGGSVQYLYFFGSDGTPYWQNVTNYRGKIKLNLQSPNVCTTSSLSGSVSVSVDNNYSATANATVVANSGYGQYCSPASRKWTGSGSMGSFTPGQVIQVTRGTTYFFHAANTTYAPNGYITSGATFVSYLAPHTAIGVGAEEVTSNSDGSWTQTITGRTGVAVYTNYAAVTSNGSAILLNNNGSKVSTGVNGGTMTNDNGNNTPSGATTEFKVYASRTSGSGGNGGQGFPTSWHDTGVTFEVTRASAHSESVTNDAGTYFDNLAGTGAAHSLTLSGLTSGYYYNVSKSSSNINTALSTWTNASTNTKTATDTAASDPGTTNTTTTTYYLWRSAFSNGSSPTYTGESYTRTIASYARFDMDDTALTSGNTFTQTISGVRSGHTYYIRSGSNTGSILASGTATNNTSLSLSVTVGANDIPNVGNTITHYLTTQSPFNSVPSNDYATGATAVISRTGTSSGGTGGTTSEYGLKVFTSGGNLLYGPETRVGRVMASGTVPTSGTLAPGASQSVTVTGLENTTDYNVVCLPTTGGAGGTSHVGFNFSIVKSANAFTITNNGTGLNNSYKYFVLKSGGTETL